MVNYWVDLVNEKELNISSVAGYALDISSESVYAKDKLRVSFLGDILAKCNKASSLVLFDHHALNQFLGLMNPILKSITFIKHHKCEYRVSFFKITEIAMWAMDSPLHQVNVILKRYKITVNAPIVHLHLQNPSSLQYSTKKPPFLNVKTLCLSRTTTRGCKTTDKFKMIAFSTNLTHLRFEEIKSKTIMKRLINQLCGSSFQSLTHLSLVSCKHIQRNFFAILLASTWPQLQHITLLEMPISEEDLDFLCLTCNGPNKKLPNFTSLCVTIPSDTTTEVSCTKLFVLPWLNLKYLYLDYKYDFNSHGLSNAIKSRKLPSLTCIIIRTASVTQQAKETPCFDQLTNLQSVYLDNCIPHGEFQITLNNLMLSGLGISSTYGLMGNLASLFVHSFPKLNALNLSNCKLTSQDLAILPQAKVKGGLPVLKYLDISHNMLTLDAFRYLFYGPCTWNELITLDIRDKFLNREDDSRLVIYLNEIVRYGYLSSLQKLGINHFENRGVRFDRLEKLFLVYCKDYSLRNISNAVCWGYRPVLQTCALRILGDTMLKLCV